MKNFLKPLVFISTLIIFSSRVSSQTLHNFFIENEGVIYKRVFDLPKETGLNEKTEVLKFISKVPHVSNVREVGDEILGDITNMKINYKKYGGTSMSTMILVKGSMFGKLIVQIKENKYRVIVKDIYFIDDQSLYSMMSKKEMDNRTDFTNSITKDNRTQFRSSSTIVTGVGYVDSYLTDIFTYYDGKKENW
jgi:hypothetical protein